MISKKTKYALKALLYLSCHSEQSPILIAELAEQERIPKKFLELILLTLKNHGILTSKKGRHGGYALARSPGKITYGEVIRILEGPIAPIPCVSQSAYRKCDECIDELRCGIRIVMKEVRDAQTAILDHTTLADALAQVRALPKDPKEVMMYYI